LHGDIQPHVGTTGFGWLASAPPYAREYNILTVERQ